MNRTKQLNEAFLLAVYNEQIAKQNNFKDGKYKVHLLEHSVYAFMVTGNKICNAECNQIVYCAKHDDTIHAVMPFENPLNGVHCLKFNFHFEDSNIHIEFQETNTREAIFFSHSDDAVEYIQEVYKAKIGSYDEQIENLISKRDTLCLSTDAKINAMVSRLDDGTVMRRV